jgi:ribonuclease J
MVGIPETAANGEPMAEIAYDAVMETVEGQPKARRRDPDAVAESVRRAVRAAVAEQWGKKPMVHVHMLLV